MDVVAAMSCDWKGVDVNENNFRHVRDDHDCENCDHVHDDGDDCFVCLVVWCHDHASSLHDCDHDCDRGHGHDDQGLISNDHVNVDLASYEQV